MPCSSRLSAALNRSFRAVEIQGLKRLSKFCEAGGTREVKGHTLGRHLPIRDTSDKEEVRGTAGHALTPQHGSCTSFSGRDLLWSTVVWVWGWSSAPERGSCCSRRRISLQSELDT